jgi:hypothetical protein
MRRVDEKWDTSWAFEMREVSGHGHWSNIRLGLKYNKAVKQSNDSELVV